MAAIIPPGRFVVRLAVLGLAMAGMAQERRDYPGWIVDDWPAAVAQAGREGKPIFAVFRCEP